VIARIFNVPYAAAILLFVAVLIGSFFWLNRPQLITIDADVPDDFPSDRFSHELFESLLNDYVDLEGNVDYEAWHDSPESVAALGSYLAAVGRFSPENEPERFIEANDALAYWLYAYNAWVIRSVLDHWPIESVTDLKAPLEVVRGLGFFHQQRFPFGGQHYSLRTVENAKIRNQYRDARIHFVLNCGSDSCPVMRPGLPTGDALLESLEAATTEFVSDPKNVSVDHENRQILLSRIFKWYRKDFLNDLAMRGRSSDRGLVDYVISVASDPLRAELDAANGYELVFPEYDWSLNEAQ